MGLSEVMKNLNYRNEKDTPLNIIYIYAIGYKYFFPLQNRNQTTFGNWLCLYVNEFLKTFKGCLRNKTIFRKMMVN